LFEFLRFADAFRSRAVLHVRTGDAERAADDVETLLRLAAMLEADPLLLGALVEVAVLRHLEWAVWEGLHAQVWPDARLQRLDELLAQFDLPKRGHEATRCEAAVLVQMYHDVANDREYADSGEPLGWLTGRWTPDWWDDLVDEVQGPLVYVMPRGWFDLWLADSLERFDRGLLRPNGVEADRLTLPMAAAMEREVRELEECYMGYFRASAFHDFRRFVERIIWVQGEIDLMRVAIALERHRLRTGGYPEVLDGLVPRELPELPIDPVTGEALRYRIKPDGTPLVYALGFNELDDGGVPARNPRSLDWVWQYTGTPGQTEDDWIHGQPRKKP
jgi:hypothetical protein